MSLNTTTTEAADTAAPTPQFLQLPTEGASAKDYAYDLHFAICEVFRLVFEHRALDMEEDPIYALNILTRLLSDLVAIIADPDSEEDERFRKWMEKHGKHLPVKPADTQEA